MANWQPLTTIYLCRDTGVDERNKPYFESNEAMANFFQTKIAKTCLNCSYQRADERQYATVECEYSIAISCDYIIFQNAGESNKWYICGITGVEWVNPNACRIFFEVDAYCTYCGEIEWQPCFVEREHVEDDWNGSNPNFSSMGVSEDISCSPDTVVNDMDDYQKKIVANVSHDFRSPLTSIKGYVEAMADGTIPPEMYGKYLNIILFETERLTDLTSDLLTLNEFDTKELLLSKAEFDIQEVIKNTAASFEAVCTPKHISIELLLMPGIIRVYADRRKIQQVLYNLIDNAIKFSENDSSVTVEVTLKNEKAFISVKDHGIGIPRKDLNKIWERFYKSDLSRGKDKKGTGLGLSIVKEVIQAHNENINVISTEGVGTEFIFSLSRAG